MAFDLRKATICVLTTYVLVLLIVIVAWSNAFQPRGAHLNEAFARSTQFIPYCLLFGLYLAQKAARTKLFATLVVSATLFFANYALIQLFVGRFTLERFASNLTSLLWIIPILVALGCPSLSHFIIRKSS